MKSNSECNKAKFGSPISMPYDSCNNPLYASFCEEIIDEQFPGKVFHVRDLSTLIQLIGKYKYNASKTGANNSLVVFRGQNELYKGCFSPSLYRRISHSLTKKHWDDQIDGLIKQIKDKEKGSVLSELADEAIEGLLQQYGLETRWIDAVDNLWIALWFACHRSWKLGNEHIHYERRDFRKEIATHVYAYIMLLQVDINYEQSTACGGLYKGKKAKYLDLRHALPSFFIRPHMQHGVLLQLTSQNGQPKISMADMVKVVVRMDLTDALTWLGRVDSLATSSLFPAPHFDAGLKMLLEKEGKWLNDLKGIDGKCMAFNRIWA